MESGLSFAAASLSWPKTPSAHKKERVQPKEAKIDKLKGRVSQKYTRRCDLSH